MIRSDDSIEILDPDIHDDYWLVMDNEPYDDGPEPDWTPTPEGKCSLYRNIAALSSRTGDTIAAAEVRCFNEAAEFTIIVDNATGQPQYLLTCGNH